MEYYYGAAKCCVCAILYFESRYMRPEGPWQRWWAFSNTTIILSQAVAGHSRAPYLLLPDSARQNVVNYADMLFKGGELILFAPRCCCVRTYQSASMV